MDVILVVVVMGGGDGDGWWWWWPTVPYMDGMNMSLTHSLLSKISKPLS